MQTVKIAFPNENGWTKKQKATDTDQKSFDNERVCWFMLVDGVEF